jgi:hypothetical protein
MLATAAAAAAAATDRKLSLALAIETMRFKKKEIKKLQQNDTASLEQQRWISTM